MYIFPIIHYPYLSNLGIFRENITEAYPIFDMSNNLIENKGDAPNDNSSKFTFFNLLTVPAHSSPPI